MAWTTPRTWQAGETVTSSMMNAHIRDNLNYLKSAVDTMGVWSRYAKTADQTINSQTSLQDITTLQQAIGASETWEFEFNLHFITSLASAYIKLSLAGPTTPTLIRWGVHFNPSGDAQTSFNAFGSVINVIANNPAAGDFLKITGRLVNSTNTGTLKAQFAQYTSDAGNTTIYAGSTLVAVKL